MARRTVRSVGLLLAIAATIGVAGCCKILRSPKYCPDSPKPTRTATPTTTASKVTPTKTSATSHTITPTPTPTSGTCAAPTIQVDRSLVVHDPAVLASPFGFRKTLQKIIDTS